MGHEGTVAAARAASYEAAEVARAVRAVLEPFGGAAGLCGGRRRVLLKPNVLRPAAPEEAVTTHPAVVRAVALEFLGAGCQVSVGDSPGGNPGPALPAFEASGIAGACRELGIPLLNFQKEGSVEVKLPYSLARSVNIAKPILEAEIIVSLPKFKTHNLTQITCALKNPFGCIPGFAKARLHMLAPGLAEFSKIICALWSVAPPAFSIVDAIVGMQGDGPSGGEPRQIGWILGGADPVAIDMVVARAMGFGATDVVLTSEAAARGLGVGALDRIEIVGARLSDLTLINFALPKQSSARWIPRWLGSLIAPLVRLVFWVRPRVIPERCELCHQCVRSCPAGAMKAEPGQVPRVAAGACISCLCCQEVCPAKAIDTHKSLIATKAFRQRREGEAVEPPAPCPGR